MTERAPTPKQRLALQLIKGAVDPSHLADMCRVAGGYGNEAEFIMRLIDRGWVTLTLTDDGWNQVKDTEE